MGIQELSNQQWLYIILTVVVVVLAFVRAFWGRFGPPAELVESESRSKEPPTASKSAKEDGK